MFKTTDYNTKITEFENKVQDVSDFDTKHRSINTMVTSNKTRQVYTESNLNEQINFNKKLIDDLIKKAGLISTKELTKELIN